MTITDIKKSIFINASPETVWSYLTDKDKLGTWYHPAEENLAVNQDYVLYRAGADRQKIRQIWGTVLEMSPFDKLVTTFIIDPFGDRETTITWTLENVFDGTRLSLVHQGIAEATGDAAMHLLMALDKGWDVHFADLREAAQP